MTAASTQSDNTLVKAHQKSTTKHDHTLTVEQDLVNVFTVADHFNVHYRTAQRWTRNKWIPHYRIGKSVRYSLKEVMDAVASHVR